MKYLNFANPIHTNEQPEILLTLIDLSGSMSATDIAPNRQKAAIRANEEIVRVKRQQYPNDKIGVIGFQGTAQLLLAPTHPSNIFALEKTIDNARLRGGTDFVSPLELAYNCFFNGATATRDDSFSKMLSTILFEPAPDTYFAPKIGNIKTTKRIIMLTDGGHLGGGDPTISATKLKNMGAVIDCIGIGGSPKDVDEKLLKQIASRNPDGSIRYCFIGDQEQLVRKYNSLAQHLRPV
jgi:hypothetical protein